MTSLRKLCAWLIAFICLTAVTAAAAQVTFGPLMFEDDADVIDLGSLSPDEDELRSLIAQLPALHDVIAYGCTLEGASMDALHEEFPQVRIHCVIHIARGHYVRTDAKVFSTLHGDCYRHSSQTLSVLRYCPELTALDLGHNDLSDISFLADLPHLRVLILADNEDLRDISVLADLHELEYLELFTTDVRDLSPLAGLDRLVDLNIANNHISSLSPILELKQLHRLWLSACGVRLDSKTLMELHEALPDTVIGTKGHPTAYGWRTADDGTPDPHYAVISQMFQQGVYIPFESSPEPFLVIDEEEDDP